MPLLLINWWCKEPTYQQPLHGPLTIYVKLRVVHAPGMPGTFSPPLQVSDPNMHHGTCVTHVPWCKLGSLMSSFLWSQWWGKHSRHSWRMRNPQFYVSGKRPTDQVGLEYSSSSTWVLIQYRIRRLIVKYCKVSKSWNRVLKCSYCFETCQASWKQCCWDRLTSDLAPSETLQDFVIRCLMRYWITPRRV